MKDTGVGNVQICNLDWFKNKLKGVEIQPLSKSLFFFSPY